MEIGGQKLAWIHRQEQGEFYAAAGRFNGPCPHDFCGAVLNLSRRRDSGWGRRSDPLLTLHVLIKKSWSWYG